MGDDVMESGRNDLLGELAADAALERKDFLVQAGKQLHRFLEANADRIAELGGMTLIDEDPDYLSIAPDLTFRSRSRFLDEASGQWTSETEVIESAAELVELYNLGDVLAAFADAAREAAGLVDGAEGMEGLDLSGGQHGTPTEGAAVYAEAADDWAAGQGAPVQLESDDDEVAARQLYDLALDFQERSQRSEARLLDQFQTAATNLSARLGDLVIAEDDDERLLLEAGGMFRAEVMTEEGEGEWQTLASPEDLVEYYDPTDIFGDLADAIAEAYPAVAPELDEDGAEQVQAGSADEERANDVDVDVDDEDDDEEDDEDDDERPEARDRA
jgi:hypothetical protein